MKLKSFSLTILLLSMFASYAEDPFLPDWPDEPSVDDYRYALSVTALPSDKAYTSGSGKYTVGSSVCINSSAKDSDWEFVHWLKDGEIYSTEDNFNYITTNKPTTFTAIYQQKEFTLPWPDDPSLNFSYKLFLSCEPEEACSFNLPSGDRQLAGESLEIKALPNQDFIFQGWYVDDILISSEPKFNYVMPNNDISLVAKFIYDPGFPGDPQGGNQGDIDNPYIHSTAILLDHETIELELGESTVLTATVLPENASNKKISWSSNNNDVASVDETGKVSALSYGSALITAKNENNTATCQIIVKAPIIEVESIVLSANEMTMTIGQQACLTASVLPENATDKTLAWVSSNPNVATVDNDGNIFAAGLGLTTITVTAANGISANCSVEVTPIPSTGIILNKTAISLVEGESETLIATILPEDATDQTIVWISSDESIAIVDSNGKITAISSGLAIVSAANGGNVAKCEVTVKSAIIEVEEIILDKTEIELIEEEIAYIVATILPIDATDKTIEWSSSDESIVIVDNEGKIIAICEGEATITAWHGTISASCHVIVKPKSLIVDLEINRTIQVYSLDGIIVNPDNLKPGIYLIKENNSFTKMYIK